MKIAKYMLYLLTLVFCSSAIAAGKAKTTICHKPDMNGGKTMTVSSSAVQKHLDKHGDYVGQCETSGHPGMGVATVELIEFDTATLVSWMLVQVPAAWMTNPDITLDIEINGLNGGYVQHGADQLYLIDSTVWSTNGVTTDTILEWTADTEPRHVNEVYTICVQPLWNATEIIGPDACIDFGPF